MDALIGLHSSDFAQWADSCCGFLNTEFTLNQVGHHYAVVRPVESGCSWYSARSAGSGEARMVVFIGGLLAEGKLGLCPGWRCKTAWLERRFCRRCTQMHADEIRTNAVSERIIGCAFRVLNTLRTGFLEKVYENAPAYEMREAGLSVAQQKGITVYYNGIAVGDYVADLVVEGTVVIELKASRTLDPADTAQCINYLKATGLHLCLSLNFGRPRLEIHRVAHEL